MGVSTMSGVSRPGEPSLATSWFTDRDPSGGERLQAVVLWRGTRTDSDPTARPLRFPILHFAVVMLLVKTGIFPRLWRRGFEAWMFGSFKDADEMRARMRGFEPLDPGWTSSSGEGAYRVLFDRRRGVVGIRSREFGPPPNGHALLLLVEDAADSIDGISVIERSVAVKPSPAQPPIDRSLAKEEIGRQMQARRRGMKQEWTDAIDADPEYQRFMERGSRPQ